jgi:cellulose synthase/poly-beta-1,6-N-acetylglucosamine synthase-like glycosyltransferase
VTSLRLLLASNRGEDASVESVLPTASESLGCAQDQLTSNSSILTGSTMETGTSAPASISFSIVMPAYNSEATIDAAIESAMRQTRRNFELIVVDDGSTDSTVSRVQRHLGSGRIKLITQPHLGSSAARNAAIAESVGEYVTLLDSDDVWLPRCDGGDA